MDREARVYDDILQMLPDTENPSPMVRINRLNPVPACPLYAKLEWLNPFGSIKDRAARYLLDELLRRGQLGHTADDRRSILEPTSGNTGLSLAVLAALMGCPMRAVVPEKVPLEKRALLKLAGAELEVFADDAPAPERGEGAIGAAKDQAHAEPDRFTMPNQYENHANVRAHYETTGPEIWRQTRATVTHFFAALGTSGTVVGAGRFLKEQNPSVRVVAVVPSEGHDVPGVRTLSELPEPNLLDESVVDEVIEVEGELAFERAAELLRTEGLRAGPSSGLIFEGARRVLQRDKPQGGAAVAMFCDDAFKYMSHFIRQLPELADEIAV